MNDVQHLVRTYAAWDRNPSSDPLARAVELAAWQHAMALNITATALRRRIVANRKAGMTLKASVLKAVQE